jgi:hypothetical protein
MVAVSVWAATYSSSYQKCVNHHANYERSNPKSNLNEATPGGSEAEVVPVFLVCEGAFIDENNGTLTALATIAIAGFTLTLWRTTNQQAKLTTDAIKLARDEFNATHRPKIRIKHVWLKSDIWQGKEMIVGIVIVNSGIGTARIGQCNIATIVWHSGRELPPNPDFSSGKGFVPAAPIMQSGITFDFTDVSTGTTLSDADNVSLREGKKRLYCYGGVEYWDDVGRVRKTAFCRILKMPDNARSHLDVGRFEEHEDSNYEYED